MINTIDMIETWLSYNKVLFFKDASLHLIRYSSQLPKMKVL